MRTQSKGSHASNNYICSGGHKMKTLPILAALAAAAIGTQGRAQTTISDTDQAAIVKAIEQADNGGADRAAETLEILCAKYPSEAALRYELGYAQMKDYRYERAAKTFRSLRGVAEMGALPWQMEGNALDLAGRRGDAVRVYRDGLNRFPNSGALIMELGTIRMQEEDYAGAIEMYERGVAADPDYASNYYRAAWIHFHSDAPWDGIALAERFMAMELKGERVEEMSQMTFEAYAALIHMAVKEDRDGTIALTAVELGFAPQKEGGDISLRVVCGVKKALHATRPDGGGVAASVWDFEERVAKAGHWEAYCRWLLRKGREDEFSGWLALHEDLMERFAEWMGRE